MAPKRLPSRALTLLVVLATGSAVGRAQAGEPVRVDLEGVKAVVRAPEGWERATETPAAGQWRVVFRGPALARGSAQCEARVFPVTDTEDAAPALVQAADQVSRQVRGDGLGLPGLRMFALEGRPAAEADLVVQSGDVRLEGRIRLLRASGTLWALAWGLAPADAPEPVRAVVRGFAATLEPSEPAFYEPAPKAADPEQVLAPAPSEEPIRRRHLEAVVATLEAAAGLSFPALAREEVVLALREDALKGGVATRVGYRDTARALAEAQGKPVEEQHALRVAVGRRVLEALERRANESYAPAQRLTLLLALGVRPGVGTAAAGLTRFEVEHLIEGSAFLASLAADQAVEAGPQRRIRLRELLQERWDALDAEGQAALRAFARAAPGLPMAWVAATPLERFALRREAALLLLTRPGPAGEPASPPPAPPGDLRRLRAFLDGAERVPESVLHAALAAPPWQLARLGDLLPRRGPAR